MFRMPLAICHKDKRITAPATTVVWPAPGVGKCIVVTGVLFTTDTEATITVHAGENEEGNRLVDQLFDAKSGLAQMFPYEIELPENTALSVTNSAGAMNIVVYGYERKL